MRIAFVCPYYDPAIDGPKQVIKELASRLIKDGHEVHVYTSDFDKEKRIETKEEVIDQVKVHRCHHLFKIANFVTFFPSVFFKLLREDFDVIHTHVTGHPHVFQASLAAKIKKTRLIHTTHCPWTSSYRSFIGKLMLPIAYNIFMRLSYKMSDKIIAITPWEISFIEKYGGRNKIVVIPNGVSNEFFTKAINNDFKEEYGIKGKLILFFGRLNKTKGVDKFVLMANDLLKERKDLDFVIVGPDEGMVDEIKKIADKRIKILGAIKDRKKIVKMYQSSEVFVLPSFREGLPLCCHPNTLIQTKESLKEIYRVNLNDMVLTHKGRFRNIIKIMKRNIDEEIICIKPYGINQEIKLTNEHLVLGIKRPKKTSKKSLGEMITKSNPIWIKAEDLIEGDCVVFPLPKYQSKLKYLDLANFDNSLRYSNNKVWYKYGFSGKRKKYSYSTLIKKTGETKRTIESAIYYLQKRNLPPRSERIRNMLNILKKYKFEVAKVNKYNRFIKIDTKLAYVVGWYIAEGSSGNGFIRFALNRKEVKYAKEIDKIINDKFGIKGNITLDGNKLSLVFCGKILESLFTKLCGKGAENKRISRELINKKLLPHILKGLFLGDGHFSKSGWQLSTISRQLANDVILSLLILKKKFNFHKSKRGIFVVYYQPNNPNISHSNKSWFVGDNICFMIKTINRERYRGLVYNLEIKDDDSYTTSSFCIHNCLFEAFASGLAVIASPVNGIPYEMKENENGFFCNYGDINCLKTSVLRLVDNKKLREKIGRNNMIKAKKYTWDDICRKTMKIYRD